MNGAPGTGTEYVFAPAEITCLPVAGSAAVFPVHRVYCVGSNYREHAREMGTSLREPPCFFSKPADAVTTRKTVPFPSMTGNLHHEAELVIALGSGGRNISAVDAPGRVFGYAAGVDLTRRDLQAEAKKKGWPWTTAKAFDCSAPLSPIRRVSECGDPNDARIRLEVNGVVRQSANTGDMTWSVPEIIAELSRYFELKAGDLVFTGTPPGVGALVPGDRVKCSIETVGELEFLVGN